MARSLRSLSGSVAAAPTHRAIFAPHPKTSACHHTLSQRQSGLACDPHLNHAGSCSFWLLQSWISRVFLELAAGDTTVGSAPIGRECGHGAPVCCMHPV